MSHVGSTRPLLVSFNIISRNTKEGSHEFEVGANLGMEGAGANYRVRTDLVKGSLKNILAIFQMGEGGQI